MSTIAEIERAVEQLPPEELAAFRQWFARFDAAAWDASIEQDAMTGRLDNLVDDAIADARAGRCSDL